MLHYNNVSITYSTLISENVEKEPDGFQISADTRSTGILHTGYELVNDQVIVHRSAI